MNAEIAKLEKAIRELREQMNPVLESDSARVVAKLQQAIPQDLDRIMLHLKDYVTTGQFEDRLGGTASDRLCDHCPAG